MLKIQNQINKNIGNIISVRLPNGYKYRGEVIDSNENFVEVFDFKTQRKISIKISEIVEYFFGELL